jgi:hypothetical protein
MKRSVAIIVLLAALAIATTAKSGHELPVYPSFYPQEIDIETIAPERAAGLLREGKLQAYVGDEPRFTGELPPTIRPVESLGAFVIVSVNPASSLAPDEASACAVARTVVRDLAGRVGDFVFHPYPVTPFHGDYLDHADLAGAAKARLSSDAADAARPALRRLRVRAGSAAVANLVRPDWRTEGAAWDASIDSVDSAELVSSTTVAMNGWLGPPWVRAGWFQAALLLADSDPGKRDRIAAALGRLQTYAYGDMVERINLARQLVLLLAQSCRKTVAGYTVKREYVSVEYSAGIENIGYDALEGLRSPMFIRTAKLKDFPWNGWLMLGLDAKPAAAWNPIAGFTDPYGRLMWFALGDPAVLPSPYDSGWMLNRIADVRSSVGR